MHKKMKKDAQGISELLDYQDLSKILKRSVNTLRRDVANHQIPFIKLSNSRQGSVRFSRDDIDKWIKMQTENTIAERQNESKK